MISLMWSSTGSREVLEVLQENLSRSYRMKNLWSRDTGYRRDWKGTWGNLLGRWKCSTILIKEVFTQVQAIVKTHQSIIWRLCIIVYVNYTLVKMFLNCDIFLFDWCAVPSQPNIFATNIIIIKTYPYNKLFHTPSNTHKFSSIIWNTNEKLEHLKEFVLIGLVVSAGWSLYPPTPPNPETEN